MRIDVNTFIGAYPWRLQGQISAKSLRAALDSSAIEQAWVTFLPSLYWKNPMDGNALLIAEIEGVPGLRPVPVIHPGLPRWEEALDWAVSLQVPCLRADPIRCSLEVDGVEMQRFTAATAARNLPVLLSVRLEDVRQRHPLDQARDLTPAEIRSLIRSDRELKLIVTHADRDFIEQVHFGSTPEESRRISWEISWIWGPPEDHLSHLVATMGAERFLFGTGQPLRIPEAAIAKLELTDLNDNQLEAIESGNALELAAL